MTPTRFAAWIAGATVSASLGALVATAIHPWHAASFGKSWLIDTLFADSVLVALINVADRVIRRYGSSGEN